MTWPIYIPTLGRPTKQRTVELLRRQGIEPHLFVEPHEEKAYRENGFQKLVVLVRSGSGLASTRNVILDYGRTYSPQGFWMIDDDLTLLGLREPIANPFDPNPVEPRKDSAGALAYLEGMADVFGLAVVGPQYDQVGFEKPYRIIERPPYVCIGIVPSRLDPCIRFDSESVPREDIDFAIQVVASGAKGWKHTNATMGAKQHGEIEGGLREVYADPTRVRRGMDRVVERWPRYAKIVMKPGFNPGDPERPSLRVDWKSIENDAKTRVILPGEAKREEAELFAGAEEET